MFTRLAALAAVLVVAPVAAGPASAWADEEVLTTAGATQPLPAVAAPAAPVTVATTATPGERQRAREIGSWAQGVLDGKPPEDAAEADRSPRCPPNDGKPHGQVWGEVGTGGYRSVGGVVTQPVGECGSVTVGVSTSEGRYGRSHRARR